MRANLDFQSDKSALLIVDMQNAFLNPQGSLARMGLDTSRVRRAVDPVLRLKRAWKRTGRPIIYLQHSHRADGLDAGLIQAVFPPIMQLGHCQEGTWDEEIVPELAPERGDIVMKNIGSADSTARPLRPCSGVLV